jgi:hypothetical protein
MDAKWNRAEEISQSQIAIRDFADEEWMKRDKLSIAIVTTHGADPDLDPVQIYSAYLINLNLKLVLFYELW